MSLTYLDRVGLIKSRFQFVSSQSLVWDDTVIEYPCECGKGKYTKWECHSRYAVSHFTMLCFHETVENQNAIRYILDKRAGAVIQKPATLEVQKVYQKP